MYKKILVNTGEEHELLRFSPSISYGFKEQGVVTLLCKNTNYTFSTPYFFDFQREIHMVDFKYCPYCGNKIIKDEEQEV